MATLSALITSLRTLVNDTPTANRSYAETPGGTIDGTNVLFKLQNQNIVAGSLYYTYDTTYRSTTGFTLNATDGYITITGTTPVSGKMFLVDYAYNFFTDTDLTEFLNNGARMLMNGGSDPTTVPGGLEPSLLQYAAYYYWIRRAAQYAHRYNSSSGGGGVGEQVDIVTANFRNMAMQAKRDGDAMKIDFYEGQGTRNTAAAASIAFAIDPMSPLR